MRKRDGFTLIELLIVIVIIGILAAIAVPKFGKTRERAYFKAMISDLRNLGTQQELYYTLPANLYNYAPTETLLPNYDGTPGVTVSIFETSTHGWAATASHASMDPASHQCGIYHGNVGSPPTYLHAAGVVGCTGM